MYSRPKLIIKDMHFNISRPRLSTMQQDELVDLLKTFSSTVDNQYRTAIEARMEQEWQSSAVNMMLALQGVASSTSTTLPLRILAAVLLRRGMGRLVITSPGDGGSSKKKPLFVTLPEVQQRQLVEGLFAALQSDIPMDLSRQISEVVAEAARVSDSAIQSLVMSFIVQIFNTNPSSIAIMSSLRILEGAPAIVPNDRNSDVAQLFTRILSTTVPNPFDFYAQLSRTIISMVSDDKGDKAVYYYGEIMRLVCSKLCNSGTLKDVPEDQLSDLLSSIIDGVIGIPKMFKSSACELYLTGLRIASGQHSVEDSGIRSLGVELSLSIAEQLTGIIRKRSDLIADGLRVILGMICEVGDDEDSEDWYNAFSPDQDEEIDEIGIVGEQSMDRFAIALTGRFIAQPLFALISSNNNSSSWKLQYGGLKAIASCAEGCMDVLEDRLGEVLGLIWPFFSPGRHPRVQYAACHALGQLCTDFGGAIQRHYCKESLECLVGILARFNSTANNPTNSNSGLNQHQRVLQHAAAALVNFAEGVDSAQLLPFMDGILENLVVLLTRSSNRPSLSQQLIATIGSFSGASGASFAKYLDGLMPIVMSAARITNPNEDMALLQCRAVEAVSLFALAVGKQLFFQNAHSTEYMDLLKSLQSNSDSDSQMVEYLQSAWVRMCQVLGGDFTPFLPICLSAMIERAQAEADVTVLDTFADTVSDEYDESEWDFAEINGRRYGIHTAVLEDKSAALENISIIADTLGIAFAPFASDCLSSLALPLLSFELHDGVEAAAAELTASCVKCILISSNENNVFDVCKNAIESLTDTAKTFYSPEYSTAAIDAISSIVSAASERHPSVDYNVYFNSSSVLDRIEKICRHASRELLKNYSESCDDNEDQNDGTFGDELETDHGEVLYAAARLFGTLCKAYKQSITVSGLLNFALEQFQPTSKSKRNNGSSSRPVSLIHSSICMVADALHWFLPLLLASPSFETDRLVQSVIGALSMTLSHSDKDVKQTAVFGIGVIGEGGMAPFEPFIRSSTLPYLIQYLHSGLSKTASHAALSDNVVSAVIKISKGYSLPLGDILPAVINGFPVRTDPSEFLNCYSFLERCLQGNQHLGILFKPNILEALLEACTGSVSKHLPDGLKASLKPFVSLLMKNLDQHVCQQIVTRYETSSIL